MTYFAYPAHRSALTDCEKLLASGFALRKAVVIFGYDYAGWPMRPAIEAFEALGRVTVGLVPSEHAAFSGLVHPVHRTGHVVAWEILRPAGQPVAASRGIEPAFTFSRLSRNVRG